MRTYPFTTGILIGLAFAAAAALFFWKKTADLTSNVKLESGQIEVGKPFPGFRARDLNNQIVDLSSADPHIRIVNFWASWCGPCRQEIPSLFALAKKFDKQVEVIAISEDDSLEDVQNALKVYPEMRGDSVHVILDSSKALSDRYHVAVLPESFVVSPKNTLLKQILGAADWQTPRAIDFFNRTVKSMPNAKENKNP